MPSTYNLPYRGLPPEIRLKIWRYCLRKEAWYRSHTDHAQGPILVNPLEAPNVAILRLDKKTHEEAQEAMQHSIWLSFLDTSLAETVRLLERISPGIRSWFYRACNRTWEGESQPPIPWEHPILESLSAIRGISTSQNIPPRDTELFLFLIRDSSIEHLILRRQVMKRRGRLNMRCNSFITPGGTNLAEALYRTGALRSLGFEICGFAIQEVDGTVVDDFEGWAIEADLMLTYEPSWDFKGENLLLTFVKK